MVYYALFGPVSLSAADSSTNDVWPVVAFIAGGLLGAVLRIAIQHYVAPLPGKGRAWLLEVGAAIFLGLVMGALLGFAAGRESTFFAAFGWVLTAFGAASAYYAVTQSERRFPAGTLLAVGHYAATQAAGFAGIMLIGVVWSIAT